ncbi:MAG: hypothetical protein JO026_01720, partial [Patescibacteria group bacterium]|nr:hypothetical protein [Patescibacteria group bacterium]
MKPFMLSASGLKIFSSFALAALVLMSGFFVLHSALAAAGPTTNNATNITETDATLNGTVASDDASDTAFWWGTSSGASFTASKDPYPSELPSGWTGGPVLGPKSAGASFSYPLGGLS